MPYLTTNLVDVAAAAPEPGDELLAEADDAESKERVRGGRVKTHAAERTGRDLFPAGDAASDGDVKTGVVGPGSGFFFRTVSMMPPVG